MPSTGRARQSVADEKDVRERVDAAKAKQAARPGWKPAPDHPWRRAFKHPSGTRREPAGFPNEPRVFHRLPTAAFELGGIARAGFGAVLVRAR